MKTAYPFLGILGHIYDYNLCHAHLSLQKLLSGLTKRSLMTPSTIPFDSPYFLFTVSFITVYIFLL